MAAGADRFKTHLACSIRTLQDSSKSQTSARDSRDVSTAPSSATMTTSMPLSGGISPAEASGIGASLHGVEGSHSEGMRPGQRCLVCSFQNVSALRKVASHIQDRAARLMRKFKTNACSAHTHHGRKPPEPVALGRNKANLGT